MNIAHWRDKARMALHGFSQWLGEGTGVLPESIHHQNKAQSTLYMDLPTLRSLLPYETCNEDGIFINKTTQGFGLHVAPCAGADESLVKSLAVLFADKLPEGADCTVLLYKHPFVAGQLAKTYAPILEQGGIYAELARMSLDFHINAIHDGYPNARNIPAVLADYRCYLFVSMPKRIEDTQDTNQHFLNLRTAFESELKAAGMGFARMQGDDFCTLVKSLLSPNPKACDWPEIAKQGELIRDNAVSMNTLIKIHDDALEFSGIDETGSPWSRRAVNCQISSLPQQAFALWQTPNLFANLLRAEHGIHCPFLISMTIKSVNQTRMQAKARGRASSLNANNNAIQNFMRPGIRDEAAEWGLVHGETSKGNWALMPVFYNVVLFTDEAHEREHVAKVIASYRQQGFTLMQSRCCQWLRFLGSLPFIMNEGLFSSLSIMGMTETMNQYNIANLLPVVADVKGSQAGLMLPTYRNQLYCLDLFDENALPITNFNQLTIASPGAGKSLFAQAQILDGLSRGQKIFVIDVGDSYKHLCEMVGGTYIDAGTISLNPFTLFDFEGSIEMDGEVVSNAEQIRDLLAIMASPDAPLSSVERALLLKAARITWEKHGSNACIDDVLTALHDMLNERVSEDDQRVKDLLILLDDYRKAGAYGKIFNAKTLLLNQSNFVVLEMGGLDRQSEGLAKIAMFALIVIIQGQFYHSDRSIQKRCIIDEAWRYLTDGSNPIAAKFIAQGFRTARKYMGAFTIITQFLADTQNTVQGQAIAASSDTKIIMRQGNFADYLQKNQDTFTPLQVEMIKSFGEAKTQGFSNIMLQCGTQTSFHRFFCDPFTRVLFSTSGDEFSQIEAMTKAGISLKEAVLQIAQKYETPKTIAHGEALCA